jgi:Zn-dependent protease with chaperone function
LLSTEASAENRFAGKRGVKEMREIRKRSGFAAVLVSVLLLAPAMLAAQSSVEPGFNLFSVEQEIEIGRQSAREVESQLPLLNDRSVEAYVNAVGQRLAVEAPHGDYPYQFKVLNIADVNAFALPAGFMYLNRGLVETVRNESELAGVLAHEIAHVALRHGTNQASKAYLASAGLGVLGGLLGGGNTGDIIGAVGGFGLNTLFLRFSRDAEEQADIVGAQIMARAGYDPLAMVDMFETLRGQQQRDPSGLEEFFSSHPPYDERQATIRDEARYLNVVDRRGEIGGLASVQAELGSMPEARRMDQLLAQRAADDEGDTTASRGRIPPRDADVAQPAADLVSFEQKDGYFSIRYPQNWRVSASANDFGATLAPADGIFTWEDGRREVVYGMIINHYVPFRGSVRSPGGLARGFTQRFETRVPEAPRHLEAATLDIVDHIRQSNPHLEVERRDAEVRTIAGAPAVFLWLSGHNPHTDETERVTIVARETEGDDHVLYALLIAPDHSYHRFEPTFDRMLSTLRVNDRAIHHR